MNEKPEVGDRLLVTRLDGSTPPFQAEVAKVGYRFFTVQTATQSIGFSVQFRLDNWQQRTSFKPEFTISRTAP